MQVGTAWARGRVVIERESSHCGEILALSAGEGRFRMARDLAWHRPGDRVDVELRLDGAAGRRWSIAGEVVAFEEDAELAVAFHVVPPGFAICIEAALAAAADCRG